MKRERIIRYIGITIKFVILSFVFVSDSFAVTETRFYTSDTDTVNGLTAYKLATYQSNSSQSLQAFAQQGEVGAVYWRSDVIKRSADGSETIIGSSVAEVSRTKYYEEGIQSSSWFCPETKLNPTDAIKIVEKIFAGSTIVTRDFITEQLNAIKLETNQWTFFRYTQTPMAVRCPFCRATGFFNYGDSAHNSSITGFKYSCYKDIGLRIVKSGQIVKIGVRDLEPTHALRISKNGIVYGIPLLSPTERNASSIRIYDGKSIKALPKLED